MITASSLCDRKDVTISSAYKNVSSGIRRFEWDDTQEIGWIKTMLEEDSIGNSSIETVSYTHLTLPTTPYV